MDASKSRFFLRIRSRSIPVLASFGCALFASCNASTPPPDITPSTDYGAFAPPAPSLRRLTRAQYANAIHDVFGEDVLVAGSMEPDTAVDSFFSVGAAVTGISPRGVEQYETLAYDIARQALASDAKKATLVPCVPSGAADSECAKKALGPLGLRLWRRPLTDDEITAAATVATNAGGTLSDFHAGLSFGIALLLQAPDFLFRAELGQPDPQGKSALLDGDELAARLSFFLWNGPPDDLLLAAAAHGDLATRDGVSSQVTRMIASPRARRGFENFVTEWLALYLLDDLVKDTALFTEMSPDIGPAARTETLLDAERLAFDVDADFRDLLTTRETFVNRKLASLYGVRAPSQTDFALVTLPDDKPRRGLLGQVSVLALGAHPTTSSPTLRGKFIQQILLCREVAPPPVNLNTALPMPSATARTMRERLVSHATDPFCAACHKNTDPVGLGLENFDGLGVYRTHEGGEAIDPSGHLDDTPFADPAGLAEVLHDHPYLSSCLAKRMYRYAGGHAETDGEAGEVRRVADTYAAAGHKVVALMTAIAKGAAFGQAGMGAM